VSSWSELIQVLVFFLLGLQNVNVLSCSH
jgi:hypothetical protein